MTPEQLRAVRNKVSGAHALLDQIHKEMELLGPDISRLGSIQADEPLTPLDRRRIRTILNLVCSEITLRAVDRALVEEEVEEECES